MIKTKICPHCKEEKSLKEFSFSKKKKTWLSWCKVCSNNEAKRWYKANSEKAKEAGRKRRKENPEKYKEIDNKSKKKYRFRRSLYSSRVKAEKQSHAPCDATPEELKAAFTGKCHLCGAPELECTQRLHMDHCHETEVENFRGWLCHNCNVMLGHLRHSVEILEKMKNYMNKHHISHSEELLDNIKDYLTK